MRYEYYDVEGLKLCPFCGSPAMIVRDTEKEFNRRLQEWGECRKCGAMGECVAATRSHYLAAKYWNKRVDE